ncbi:MAG: nitroreductase family protein [Candidatus Altiarchaeota archaeon]
MEILETIQSRRSVRAFEDREVNDSLAAKILEAGRWAPSGLNNQPWRFLMLKDPTRREAVSKCTKYGGIILAAPLCIAVYFDADSGYDRTKDVQAVGACIQNMLLEAHSLGLGAVWLGEILNRKEKVNEMLGVGSTLELMAVLAIGFPKEKPKPSSRLKLEQLMIEDAGK